MLTGVSLVPGCLEEGEGRRKRKTSISVVNSYIFQNDSLNFKKEFRLSPKQPEFSDQSVFQCTAYSFGFKAFFFSLLKYIAPFPSPHPSSEPIERVKGIRKMGIKMSALLLLTVWRIALRCGATTGFLIQHLHITQNDPLSYCQLAKVIQPQEQSCPQSDPNASPEVGEMYMPASLPTSRTSGRTVPGGMRGKEVGSTTLVKALQHGYVRNGERTFSP